MSSGSYFPGPVRGVEIPKDHGEGVRLLGVPNTADRVAQTAAAMLLEEKLEPVFHRDSYGYRPGRSAHDALAVCRRRCWKQDWVLDLDIRAFFDSVPHSLLLKAVAHHTSERWVLLCISRWLVAPMQMPDGTVVARDKGTSREPGRRRTRTGQACGNPRPAMPSAGSRVTSLDESLNGLAQARGSTQSTPKGMRSHRSGVAVNISGGVPQLQAPLAVLARLTGHTGQVFPARRHRHLSGGDRPRPPRRRHHRVRPDHDGIG
jgi:hypothetical protein